MILADQLKEMIQVYGDPYQLINRYCGTEINPQMDHEQISQVFYSLDDQFMFDVEAKLEKHIDKLVAFIDYQRLLSDPDSKQVVDKVLNEATNH